MAEPLSTGPAELVSLKVPREQVPPVSHVRSTLLASSLRSLRERGLFDAYLTVLPPAHHDVLLSAVAGTWHEVAVALAHYEACDGLGLTEAQAFEIGVEVGSRIQTTLMGSIVKMASGAGLTPWMALNQCGAFFERLYKGGGVRLVQLGPKEAQLEMVGQPLQRFSYFRNAQRGTIQAACQLFCKRAYVFEQPSYAPAKRLSHRISWV